jgi:hypothetical protein
MSKTTQPWFGRVAQLLREFPFLWGVKREWSHDETIEVLAADATPSYGAYNISHDLKKSWCWVHFVTGSSEQVVRIELEGSDRRMWDALDYLHVHGFKLKHAAHIVTHTEGGLMTRVWRVLHPCGFREMYLEELRHQRQTGLRTM